MRGLPAKPNGFLWALCYAQLQEESDFVSSRLRVIAAERVHRRAGEAVA